MHRTLASCFASIALFACSAVHASAGVRLSGHVHALAQAAFDRGEVPGTLSLGLELVLRPTPAREQALRVLLAQQRDVQSLQYQRWLTPAEYSARFGVGADDLAALTNWLRAQGFRVGPLAAGGARLTFSGTAAQVASAFQTPIHYFDRDGRRHYANVAAPEVPSELATLIGGIRGLNDFHPHVAARLPRVPAAGLRRRGRRRSGRTATAKAMSVPPTSPRSTTLRRSMRPDGAARASRS